MPDQLTAREAVSFFAQLRGIDRRNVVPALASVSLESAADRRVREFSGGMLQRLGLAVAFLEEADIYVLDEPTLNLDPVGLDRFRERIATLKGRGATVFFSTHILQDAAQLADRVGILAEGALARVDSLGEFRSLVSLETTVRVVLSRTSPRIVEAAVAAGAKTASVNGTHYSFRASPELRLEVIRAIENAGGSIEEFHTDPPDWERLIKQGMVNLGGNA
jgi:ABC-type multidrug transport system ATPase subunit